MQLVTNNFRKLNGVEFDFLIDIVFDNNLWIMIYQSIILWVVKMDMFIILHGLKYYLQKDVFIVALKKIS